MKENILSVLLIIPKTVYMRVSHLAGQATLSSPLFLKVYPQRCSLLREPPSQRELHWPGMLFTDSYKYLL